MTSFALHRDTLGQLPAERWRGSQIYQLLPRSAIRISSVCKPPSSNRGDQRGGNCVLTYAARDRDCRTFLSLDRQFECIGFGRCSSSDPPWANWVRLGSSQGPIFLIFSA